jgi:UrcA family protein
MKTDTNNDAKLFARFAGLVLIGCAFAVAKLFAAEPAPAATVKYQDLNLNDSAGVAALYRRIHSASRHVCGLDEVGHQSLAERSTKERCAREAESKAVNDVHSGALSAYYQMKLGLPYGTVARNEVK